MENKFSAILLSQENTDIQADENRFRQAVLSEFSNGEQILKEAARQGFTVERFRKDGERGLVLPFIPVRTAKNFSIKKHTSVQRPYTHSHDFYELIYVHRGECVQICKRKNIVSSQGDLCIISPETVHSMERCSEGDVILKAVVPRKLYNLCSDGILPAFEGIKTFRTKGRVEYLIAKLVGEELFCDRLHEKVVQSYLTLLFAELQRAAEKEKSAIEIKAEEYVRENIKNATLQSFAQKIGYSSNYLSRLIKEKTGDNFRQILIRTRMEFSLKLLDETTMSVEDIAAETGYENASGFYKQFFLFYGMTPMQYRNTLQ